MLCKILIILNIVSVLECMDHQYFANDSKNQMDTEQEAIVKRDIERQDRIYGGVNCPAEEFKIIVSIRAGTTHFEHHVCGATLINKNWALTAAHCHVHKESPYHVMAGITNSNNAKPVITKVSKWYLHEDYKLENISIGTDIALALLEKPIEESQYIKYVKLPTKDLGDIRQFCPEGLVKGWGDINELERPETEQDLQCFNESINSADCSFPFVPLDDLYMCLIDPNKKGGICVGDSGSPLMCNGIQIGVCSFTTPSMGGLACNMSGPQGYVRVDRHLGFINNIMKTHTPRKGCSPNVNCMSISMWIVVFFNVFRQFLDLM